MQIYISIEASWQIYFMLQNIQYLTSLCSPFSCKMCSCLAQAGKVECRKKKKRHYKFLKVIKESLFHAGPL